MSIQFVTAYTNVSEIPKSLEQLRILVTRNVNNIGSLNSKFESHKRMSKIYTGAFIIRPNVIWTSTYDVTVNKDVSEDPSAIRRLEKCVRHVENIYMATVCGGMRGRDGATRGFVRTLTNENNNKMNLKRRSNQLEDGRENVDILSPFVDKCV